MSKLPELNLPTRGGLCFIHITISNRFFEHKANPPKQRGLHRFEISNQRSVGDGLLARQKRHQP